MLAGGFLLEGAGDKGSGGFSADVAPVDVLGLEVGYRLIPLVDKAQDGELLRRIRGIRKRFAQDGQRLLGFAQRDERGRRLDANAG